MRFHKLTEHYTDKWQEKKQLLKNEFKESASNKKLFVELSVRFRHKDDYV